MASYLVAIGEQPSNPCQHGQGDVKPVRKKERKKYIYIYLYIIISNNFLDYRAWNQAALKVR